MRGRRQDRDAPDRVIRQTDASPTERSKVRILEGERAQVREVLEDMTDGNGCWQVEIELHRAWRLRGVTMPPICGLPHPAAGGHRVKVWTAVRRFAARRSGLIRIGTLVTLLAAAWVIAWQSGLLEALDVETLRETVLSYGWAGVAVFVVSFCVLNLLQVPAMLMIIVSIVAWGPLLGTGVGWTGAVFASCSTFLIGRFLGGTSLGGLKHPWARRLLEGLERRPIITLILLRSVFQAAAPLNLTLALTSLPFRSYLLGTALGLIPPVLFAALLTDLLI